MSTGEMYVVCPVSRWKGPSCVTKLLAAIKKPATAAVHLWLKRTRS